MKDSTVLLVVGMVLVVVLVAPSAFKAFGNFASDLLDWVKHGWDDVLPTDGDQKDKETDQDAGTNETRNEGTVGIGVVLHFKDGSEKTVSPEQSPFTFPFTVYVGGYELDYITYTLQLSVDWEGEMTSFKVTGQLRSKAVEENLVLRQEGLYKEWKSGDMLPRNTWVTVWSFNLDDDDIDMSLPDGDHTLRSSADLTIEAMFASGAKDTKTVGGADIPSTDVNVTVVGGGVTALSVQIDAHPF